MQNHKLDFLSKCIIIDTETDNIDYAKAEVIELGVAMFNEAGCWKDDSFLHKPSSPIMPEISAITNITNRMVKDCQYFSQSAGDYQSLISTYDVIVAHNAVYDMNVLKHAGVTAPRWLDTLRLAKKLYSDDLTVTQYNLAYLRYRFEIMDPADGGSILAHRAGADALVTGILLDKLVNEMERRNLLDVDVPYFPQIEEFLSKPILLPHMPFGKWKGTAFKEIPVSYWNWAIVNMDCFDNKSPNYDMDLSASVEAALS